MCDTELRLRFSTTSFVNLRCSHDVPLCVNVGFETSGCCETPPPPAVRATAHSLNVEPRDLASMRCGWTEPGEDSPPLKWVGQSLEVDKILVFAAHSTTFAEMVC